MLIGNGWIEPEAGYKSYLPYALQTGLLQHGSEAYDTVNNVLTECLQAIKDHGVEINIPQCEGVLQSLYEATLIKDAEGTNMCLNGYDRTLKDTFPSCGANWPLELQYVSPYLRRSDVLEAIHAEDQVLGWRECSGLVGSRLRARNSAPSSTLFPDLLKQVPILLFSGSNDIICNHISTEMFIAELEWNGEKGFGAAQAERWIHMGEDIGTLQTARNLTYVLFSNASHMVPYDFAERTRKMLDNFMKVTIQQDGDQEEDISTPDELDNDTKDTTNDDSKQGLLEKYKQYYKAGSVALVIVILAVLGLVWFIWKHKGSIRRRYGFDKLGLQESGGATDTELEELVSLLKYSVSSVLMWE